MMEPGNLIGLKQHCRKSELRKKLDSLYSQGTPTLVEKTYFKRSSAEQERQEYSDEMDGKTRRLLGFLVVKITAKEQTRLMIRPGES